MDDRELNAETESPEIEYACAVAATMVAGLIATGQLPANVWAFIRPIPILGHPGSVSIWTIFGSPN